MSQAKRLNLGKINVIYYQSNQGKLVRNKILKSSPQPSILPGLHSLFVYVLPASSTGKQGMGAMINSSYVSADPSFLPQRKDPSPSSLAPVWGPSHGRKSSVNFSTMSPSHRIPFFMNCCSMDPFYRAQTFSNRLFQHESSTGSQFC